jgi:hypothetical protein
VGGAAASPAGRGGDAGAGQRAGVRRDRCAGGSRGAGPRARGEPGGAGRPAPRCSGSTGRGSWQACWNMSLRPCRWSSGRARGAGWAGGGAAGGAGPTLAYALPGFVLATIVGGVAGLRAARRAVGSTAGCWRSTVLMSTSSVIVVVLGQYWLAHRLRLFPVLGWPLGGDARGVAWFVVLPALLWAVIQLGPICGTTGRCSCASWRRRTSRGCARVGWMRGGSRGTCCAGRRRRCWRGSRLSLPHVVLGGVVVEHVFNIPGVGALLVAAIRDADLPVVQGIAFVLAAATIAGQVVCDGGGGVDRPARAGRWEAGR